MSTTKYLNLSLYVYCIYIFIRSTFSKSELCRFWQRFIALFSNSPTFLLSLSFFHYIYMYIYLCSCSAYTDNIIRIRNFHLKAFSFNEIKTYVRIACMYIMYVCVSVCVYIINKTVVGERTNRNEMI